MTRTVAADSAAFVFAFASTSGAPPRLAAVGLVADLAPVRAVRFAAGLGDAFPDVEVFWVKTYPSYSWCRKTADIEAAMPRKGEGKRKSGGAGNRPPRPIVRIYQPNAKSLDSKGKKPLQMALARACIW